MKILVINGSPKGKNSVTLQTVKYIEKHNREHEFTCLDAARHIRALERDLTPALKLIAESELIIFSYPVYTFIAPCQLHRFIELMKQSGVDFGGKIATQVTTSKHFYDTTAHSYITENCMDMGIRVIEGLSADMDDLLEDKGRQEALGFFKLCLYRMENGFFKQPAAKRAPYTQGTPKPCAPAAKKGGDVVIVTDANEGDAQLNLMIERFRAVLPLKTRIVNIASFGIKGGCMGCFGCAATGECVYKDGFTRLLREDIQKSDAIIYAFTVKDHSMGVRFKMYDDRQFCNGHRTVTMGAPTGYLICGDYMNEENLRTILEARAQVGGNYLCGTAVDDEDVNENIDRLAAMLAYAIENKLTQPANFLGVGGMKIFRDLIYMMRGMMRMDHKFFKAHGQYDFPQKQRVKSMLMYLVGAMLKNPKLVKKLRPKMNEGMLMPYIKVLNDPEK